MDITLALAIMALGVALLIYAYHRWTTVKKINLAKNDNAPERDDRNPPF